MTLGKIIEGMQIVAKYEGADAYCICAEHDKIWCGSPAKMSAEDVARMKALGWREDHGGDSWSAFV